MHVVHDRTLSFTEQLIATQTTFDFVLFQTTTQRVRTLLTPRFDPLNKVPTTSAPPCFRTPRATRDHSTDLSHTQLARLWSDITDSSDLLHWLISVCVLARNEFLKVQDRCIGRNVFSVGRIWFILRLKTSADGGMIACSLFASPALVVAFVVASVTLLWWCVVSCALLLVSAVFLVFLCVADTCSFHRQSRRMRMATNLGCLAQTPLPLPGGDQRCSTLTVGPNVPRMVLHTYGTRDAGRSWYQHLRDKLASKFRVHESALEKGLYLYEFNGRLTFVTVTHVEDLFYA